MKWNLLHVICLFAVVICSNLTVFSQETDTLNEPVEERYEPISFETHLSNKGMLTDIVWNKHFSPTGRLGIFALTEYYGQFKAEDQQNQFMVQTYLTVDIWKGFGVVGGIAINNSTGFNPVFGLKYGLPIRNFYISFLPRVEFLHNFDAELETFLSYSKMFTDKWGIYAEMEGVHNWSLKYGFHEISYLRPRIGAAYKKFQFGFGYNYTTYGPDKIKEHLYGVFLRTELGR